MKLLVNRSFLFLLLLASFTAYGQEFRKVEGRVVDSATGEGIPLCNVYLSGTSYGILTDDTGQFKIEQLPVGEYTLVISHIAFGNMVRSVDLFKEDQNLGLMKLKEKVTDLTSDVTIESSEDKKWKSRFRKLSKFMMGENFKPKNIEFKNAWVAEFSEVKRGVLRPTNEFSLQIDNRHLGYHTNYLVKDFLIGNRLQYVVGYPSFQALESGNKKEQKRWTQNREKAYQGSLRHFFKSLLQNTLEENEFITNLTNFDPEVSLDHFDRVLNKSKYNKPLIQEEAAIKKLISIEPTDNANIMKISCESIFEVYHLGTVDKDGEMVRSLIKPETSSFLVYTNGVLVNVRSVRLFGFFSQKGLYDMLPFEYEMSK